MAKLTHAQEYILKWLAGYRNVEAQIEPEDRNVDHYIYCQKCDKKYFVNSCTEAEEIIREHTGHDTLHQIIGKKFKNRLNYL